MSKDALAGVYSQMLDDSAFRDQVAENPNVLDTWDLTAEEKKLLIEDAETDVAGFAIGSGGVMGYMGSGTPLRRPRLKPRVKSLNTASGFSRPER